MTRPATSLVVLALLVAAVASPLAAAAPQSATEPSSLVALQAVENKSAKSGTGDPAPGATLNGALGSEGAELEGEFERRSLDHAVGTTTVMDARADVVADRLATIEQRLATLEAREERLKVARRNGTITDAEYRARMTVVAAEARSLDRLGSRTASYANALPPEALSNRDVTSERVTALQATAANLSTFDGDIFGGTYGDAFPNDGPVEPVPGDAVDDSWWNNTTFNGSLLNDTDGLAWNVTFEAPTVENMTSGIGTR